MDTPAPKVIEIRNFTTFTNDQMETILATDRKMHITEMDAAIQGYLAAMDAEGCFVLEVSVKPARIPEEQKNLYPNGICYRFVSEDPIIAPNISHFILFWASEVHAHAVEVVMI